MISKLFVLSVIFVMGAVGQYTPQDNQFLLYSLRPFYNQVDLFDGPAALSQAPTTTTIQKPTLDEMKYYNYYTASMYCPYQLSNLSCLYCQKFKGDVVKYTVINNNDQNLLALVTVSEKRKEIVVTFQGTFNVWGAILDAILIQGSASNNPDIKVHRGFYIAAMGLYEDVVKNIGNYRENPLTPAYKGYKIVVAGHSLGAGMARLTQFFFLDLNQFPGTTYELYVYGEPRGGNKAYVDFFNNLTIKTARVTARGDIITHVPPVSVLSVLNTTLAAGDFYYHAQTEFWVNGESGQRWCNQTIYEDPTCGNSMGPLYEVSDHLQYFDANYLTCYTEQPAGLLSLPLGILNPVETIPALPTKISSFNGALTNIVVQAILPLLG